MKIAQWRGLLTNASAYAVPPGGAIVQINLNNTVPGQLSCRGGMRRVALSEGLSGGSDIRELFRYAYGTDEKLLVFDATGAIQVVSSPALGAPTPNDEYCQPSIPIFPGGANYPPGAGGGTSGGSTTPPGTQIGACCVGGVCVPGRTPEQCMLAGGVWMGNHTTCLDTVCSPDEGGGGGGGGGAPGGYDPCVIDGGDAFAECCACGSLDGGNAFTCCN